MGWIRISVDETLHVAWQVQAENRNLYLHAIGEGPDGNEVTEEMARMRFDSGKCITPWLPVLFPDRAITSGDRAQLRECGDGRRFTWLVLWALKM